MTANRDTFIASVKSADATKTSSVTSAVMAAESTITASKNDVGFREPFPAGFATYDAAVKLANSTKLQALSDAERVRQQAVQVARDLLRGQGELP